MTSTITVCICTFKRPELLEGTLRALLQQRSNGRFNYSVVVTDNDAAESARDVVMRFRSDTGLEVAYSVEEKQNIACARNKAISGATGDFVALIDDDEVPTPDWLATLLSVCVDYHADGALGPVRPLFDRDVPTWLVRSRLCERPEHQTGLVLDWSQTRTGNVLFRREILCGIAAPFRPEFGSGGEDQDFFRRLMQHGYKFVWANEAVVYEVVPPERRTRAYFLKRALLRGQNERLLLSSRSILRSLIAVPVYTVLIPFVSVGGQHNFMKFAVRLCDHIGKLLVAMGVKTVHGVYLNN